MHLKMFKIITMSGVERSFKVLRRQVVELLGSEHHVYALASRVSMIKIKITLLLIRVRIKTRTLKRSQLSY